MGINFSQVLSGESGITSDCKMNGYDYQVKGTYFSMSCFCLLSIVKLLICGQERSGKTLLFKSLQKSSSVVLKKPEDPSFTTTISWKNILTNEKANVWRVFC